MPKKVVAFEVDVDALFEALQKMGGDTSGLGQRMVELLLAPAGFTTQVGMAMYGVSIVDPVSLPQTVEASREA